MICRDSSVGRALGPYPSDAGSTPAPGYHVIYADPPWQYRDKCHAGKRGAGYHYRTMSTDELAKLQVSQIAAEDCALFLWATCPMMPDALRLIGDWGFKFRTIAFVWVKTNQSSPTLSWGMGHWTRSNAELCLLGTRGKPKRSRADVHQVIISPRRRHSEKPPEARLMIERLMGEGKRIELFARQRAEGWDAWGDEVPNE